jgi:tetratricopeptide (TPR) repeat protein
MEAFQSLKWAIKSNPNFSIAYRDLGRFYQSLGLENYAIKCLSKGIERDPLLIHLYAFRALSFLRLGEIEKAEKDYQKLMEIEPQHLEVRNYVFFLTVLQRFDEAEKLINQLEEAHPDRNFHYNNAIIYAAKGEKEKALNSYLGTSELTYSILYSLLGMKDEAIEALKKNLEEDKKVNDVFYWGIKNYSYYNSIRSDPRFQDILVELKKMYEENLRKYGEIDI